MPIKGGSIKDGTGGGGGGAVTSVNTKTGDVVIGFSDLTDVNNLLSKQVATVTPSNNTIANNDNLQTVVNKTQGQFNGLSTVAKTGAYNDLTGKPTLGTAAAKDVGTSAGNVVMLDGSAKLPAVDGSQLTNISGGASYTKCGLDFTTSTNPTRVYRDVVWCATAVSPTIYAANVPWICASIDDAEKLAGYWLQQLVLIFKNLENDTHYDQVFGAIPSALSSNIISKISSGTICATPSYLTDMDGTLSIASSSTYLSEWYELIVGANPAGTILYTMSFTIALVATANNNPDMLYPFRIIYQTQRGAPMVGFNNQTVNPITSDTPRCTQYNTSVTLPALAYALCAEPVSIESRR